MRRVGRGRRWGRWVRGTRLVGKVWGKWERVLVQMAGQGGGMRSMGGAGCGRSVQQAGGGVCDMVEGCGASGGAVARGHRVNIWQ